MSRLRPAATFAVTTLIAFGAPPPHGDADHGNCSFDSSASGDDFDVALDEEWFGGARPAP